MRFRRDFSALFLIGIGLTLLAGVASGGWTLVPLAGYSSTTGFAYGAMVAGQGELGLDALSLQAYRTTKSREVLELSMLKAGLGGLTSVSIEHYRTPTARFFGYGNGGDEETWAEYSEESHRLRGLYTRHIHGPLFGGIGLDLRHAVVYGREDSPLWETLPEKNFSSTWAIGPRASLTLENPVGAEFPGYVKANATYQFSDGGQFARVTARVAEFATLPLTGTVMGAHVGLTRHFEIGNTHFTWRPTLGEGDDLRGYRDWRFSGQWSLWSNLELRQNLVTISDEPDAYVRSIGIVLFGDAGQVGEELSHFEWRRFRLCAGIGLRLFMAGGVTVRADFSRSPEGTGIVLTFGEMF